MIRIIKKKYFFIGILLFIFLVNITSSCVASWKDDKYYTPSYELKDSNTTEMEPIEDKYLILSSPVYMGFHSSDEKMKLEEHPSIKLTKVEVEFTIEIYGNISALTTLTLSVEVATSGHEDDSRDMDYEDLSLIIAMGKTKIEYDKDVTEYFENLYDITEGDFSGYNMDFKLRIGCTKTNISIYIPTESIDLILYFEVEFPLMGWIFIIISVIIIVSILATIFIYIGLKRKKKRKEQPEIQLIVDEQPEIQKELPRICKSCGVKLEENEKYCARCGEEWKE